MWVLTEKLEVTYMLSYETDIALMKGVTVTLRELNI